jgi:hypothetical protein
VDSFIILDGIILSLYVVPNWVVAVGLHSYWNESVPLLSLMSASSIEAYQRRTFYGGMRWGIDHDGNVKITVGIRSVTPSHPSQNEKRYLAMMTIIITAAISMMIPTINK